MCYGISAYIASYILYYFWSYKENERICDCGSGIDCTFYRMHSDAIFIKFWSEYVKERI